MNSSDLTPSPTWVKMAAAIEADMASGMSFEDSLTMNVAIKMRDPLPYIRHRERLDEVLWYDDPGPKTIIEVGAGYGAMANHWPCGSQVVNVDLPVMLGIQAGYLESQGFVSGQYRRTWTRQDCKTEIRLVPIDDADGLVFHSAYLFSVWALTETTMDTWRYYIEKAPQLAGAYILGFNQWTDETEPWPWLEMARQFIDIRKLRDVHPSSFELAGVNR